MQTLRFQANALCSSTGEWRSLGELAHNRVSHIFVSHLSTSIHHTLLSIVSTFAHILIYTIDLVLFPDPNPTFRCMQCVKLGGAWNVVDLNLIHMTLKQIKGRHNVGQGLVSSPDQSFLAPCSLIKK